MKLEFFCEREGVNVTIYRLMLTREIPVPATGDVVHFDGRQYVVRYRAWMMPEVDPRGITGFSELFVQVFMIDAPRAK